jgi:dTDP-L-rhamnose 4-epimerase
MKKILVTGGAGFIGSRLARHLADSGHTVVVLDNLSPQIHGENAAPPAMLDHPSITFIMGSVTDRADLVKALSGVDALAHLAAETGTGQSMYAISHYNFVNAQATAVLLDVLAEQPNRSVERIILTSSRSVYGEGRFGCGTCNNDAVYPDCRSSSALAAQQWEPLCPKCGSELDVLPTREIDATRPASIYAATKLAQEELVRITSSSLGIGYAIFRLQNVYGEGQSLKNPYTGILSIFSTKVRRGAILPLFEDGEETRDFVHVDDVVDALVAGITGKAPNSIMNVGSGVATSVRSVASLLNSKLDGHSKTVITGEYRLGDIRHNVADISRLTEYLGHGPKVSLDAGMQRFAAWVQSQPLPEDLLDQANAELRARKLMV